MIGQLLLQYRIVEKIGEGGLGTVYRAIDTMLDRPAVVKVLPPALTDSFSNLLRFEREARLASSLDHPNVMVTRNGVVKLLYVSPFQTAIIYAGLDNRKLALDWLEKSRAERFNWLPFLQVDPAFKNLRADERFVELSKSLGLPTINRG